jgi:hypothetical protein
MIAALNWFGDLIIMAERFHPWLHFGQTARRG